MALQTNVEPGSVIVIRPHSVDGARRMAEVLEVIGNEYHRRYRVRWDDGHESILYPSHDAIIESAAASRKRRASLCDAPRGPVPMRIAPIVMDATAGAEVLSLAGAASIAAGDVIIALV
jgi:hypothetical protein